MTTIGRFGASDVVIRRRPLRWPFVALALVLPLLTIVLDQYWLTACFVLVEALVFLLLPAFAIESQPVGQQLVPELHADRDGVHFGARLALRRDDVASVGVEHLADGRATVQLWGRRAKDDLTVILPDAAGAEKLVDALGLGADGQAACFSVDRAPLRPAKQARIMNALRLLGAAVIFGFVVAVTWHHELFGLTLMPFLMLYFAIVRRLRFRQRITLGADALVVDEPTGLAEITGVTHGSETSAIVQRRNGADLDLRFDAVDKRDAFATRLGKALSHGKGDIARAAELVAPCERTRARWLGDLRKLGSESFRGASIPTEELWRIVEHPGADAGARAGAVAALVPHLDDQARIRIGALAESTAHAELRAALEAAASEDATDERVLEAYLK